MKDFVPIDPDETDPAMQLDITCYPNYLGYDDGELHLDKELYAIKRFNFSEYMHVKSCGMIWVQLCFLIIGDK